MTTKLARIAHRARTSRVATFTNLGHVIDMDLLATCYHELDGRKAVGADGISKEIYGCDLIANLSELLTKIRRGTYSPSPSRLVEIPKENGTTRPLAIATLEDKVVQMAVNKVLTALYEPLFLKSSYGFRPNRGTHDAVKALVQGSGKVYRGAIVELDIKNYFNSIPQDKLLSIIGRRISDSRFTRLLEVLLKAPVLKDGNVLNTIIGVPQGSIASPILANIYLHEILDEWFELQVKPRLKEAAKLIRYADDAVILFKNPEDAKRVYEVLGKRFEKFGLEIHPDKTQILAHGCDTVKEIKLAGKKPPSFDFLGFRFYWALAKSGTWYRLKPKSRRDRMQSTLKSVKADLRKRINHRDIEQVFQWIAQTARGWLAYHNVSDNERSCHTFLLCLKKCVHRWLNRRGGNRKIGWIETQKCLDAAKFPTHLPRVISLFTSA